MAKWCLAHHQESFLYTHFREKSARSCAHTTSRSRSATGLRPGQHRRRQRRSAVRRAEDAGRAHEDRLGVRRAGDERGPGHIPMHLIKENMEKQLEWCDEAPFYTLGPLTTDVAPGYDHITSRNRGRDDRMVRHGDALLRHAEGTSRPARQRGRQGGRHRLQDRRACSRSGERPPAARRRGTTRSRRRGSSSGGKISSIWRSIRLPRAPTTTRRLPADGAKVAHFCSMCGPKFCSMELTQQVRDYAATNSQLST